MAICGVWEKQSYKRYSTSVGGLHIEVVRWDDSLTGLRYWRVGEVFGNHHHGLRDGNQFKALEDAQDAAEKVALKYLAAVDVGLKYRPWR